MTPIPGVIDFERIKKKSKITTEGRKSRGTVPFGHQRETASPVLSNVYCLAAWGPDKILDTRTAELIKKII